MYKILNIVVCLNVKKRNKSKDIFFIFSFRFVKQDQICVAKFQTAGIVCMETFAEFPQMGRFTLRDEGKSLFTNKRHCERLV